VVVTTSIFYFVVGFHLVSGFGFPVTLAVGIACSLVALGLGTAIGKKVLHRNPVLASHSIF
jgi:putative effector of murein hydrolase